MYTSLARNSFSFLTQAKYFNSGASKNPCKKHAKYLESDMPCISSFVILIRISTMMCGYHRENENESEMQTDIMYIEIEKEGGQGEAGDRER